MMHIMKPCNSGMGLKENVSEIHNKKNRACQTSTLCMHAFYDLAHVSPVVFLYLLKECYFYGTSKATAKFRALQHQVYLVLHNDPKPGPATFVVQCLYVSPLFEDHSRGFSHLVISALRRFLKRATASEDSSEAKNIAAHLFLDIVCGRVSHDKNITVKVLEIFDVRLTNVEKVMCQLKAKNNSSCGTAKECIEQYIFELVESQLYMTAVTLIEHFSIRQSGQSFLLSMIQGNQFKAAEKWAIFMGKPMLRILVEEYICRNMLQDAYETIKENNLQKDFPDLYQSFEESSLKKLAEKGYWDVAEARTNSDKQLIEYLVYLAMEAGYTEKVDELCDRYCLDGFSDIKVPETRIQHGLYLHLNELFVEDIIWVDEIEGLLDATNHIEGCKLIGIDCEWKPNHVKGSKPNKVSIMQIASEKMVFIFDLIKLHGEVPEILDNCLIRILQSPRILKLGYNFLCDIKQLAHSYEELSCFKHYEKLLDIQNIFKEPRGGLSGLAEKILGAGLNKARRISNWEQRPLTPNQLEYAALDAVVLIHIFCHLRGQPQTSVDKFEWKSHIVSYTESTEKSKKYTYCKLEG
ncbi:Exonuclease mut-7-like isoform A [Senna tora]|uniref:Exonuclease mut-7-like isoform A n=1 Tax=Senna tora TaxID=362788 RepID=A0A834TAB5_9FABA|nr:Exonuclease mut-7-like isoform A [Senna tora]